MRRCRRVIAALLPGLLGVALLTSGCGDDKFALAKYLVEVKPMIEAEAANYQEVYQDFDVVAEGRNTMVFDYTYREELDADQIAQQQGLLRDEILDRADEILHDLREWGVADPRARWVYRNPDKSELFQVEVPIVRTEPSAKLVAFVDDIDEEIQVMLEESDGVFTDVGFSAIDANTVRYSYTFAEPTTADAAEQARSEVEESLPELAPPVLVELERLGVTEPVVQWVYYNPDGSVAFRLRAP